MIPELLDSTAKELSLQPPEVERFPNSKYKQSLDLADRTAKDWNLSGHLEKQRGHPLSVNQFQLRLLRDGFQPKQRTIIYRSGKVGGGERTPGKKFQNTVFFIFMHPCL